ncbi:MAG: CPBP family glutamic-type intramembrane protease [Candidatus Binatus sp.]|uniref:CPBP family glutamic-type intramembrane protease n=1 Tax=Candidatus Binatus sp. TaxID=2811406 RepID=UPI003C70892E
MRSLKTKIYKFDFWFCFGVESAAFLGLYVSWGGLHIGPGTASLVYFGAAVLYAAVTAAIVAWLAPRAGVTPVPLFESWWLGQLRIRMATARVVAAAGIGAATSYLAYYYGMALTGWLGTAVPKALLKRHTGSSVLDFCCEAILEEILNRAIIFVALIVLARWGSRLLSRTSEMAAIWTANLLQALIFGGAHVALGLGVPRGRPWYVRLPLSTQTWSGLILGWIYWKYGLESAIACHATFDIAIAKMIPTLR